LWAIDRIVNIVIVIIGFSNESVIFIALNVKNTVDISTSYSYSSNLLLHYIIVFVTLTVIKVSFEILDLRESMTECTSWQYKTTRFN